MGNGYKTFLKRLFTGLRKVQKEKNISDEELVAAVNKIPTEEDNKAIGEMQKEFGKQLRGMREKAGWTVEELSVKSKVPIATIQLLEAGLSDESLETIFLITKALNKELKYKARS